MPRLWVLVVLVHMVYPQDIRRPPSITKGPITSLTYRPGEDIVLECEATGTPPPEFEWRRNNIPLVVNMHNIERLTQGSIRISQASYINEGYYQCFASNQHGIALSVVSILQMALLDSYKPGIPIVEKTAVIGQSATLNCQPIKSIPKATFSWSIAKDTVDEYPTGMHIDRRVQIDENGNLNFAYVTKSDERNGYLYKCNVFNPRLDQTTSGSYSRINVKPGPENPVGPSILFSSGQSVVMLENSNSSIRCFFAGNPESSINWKRKKGMLPVGRHNILNFNTELMLKHVTPEDEGEYVCTGGNGIGTSEHTIFIDVQAIPVFKKEADRPQNLNFNTGDTATFRCDAYAEPEAKVVWLRNGESLDAGSLPPRFQLSTDHKELSIQDVCKQCPDGSSSLMVIQCNASNVHGYAYAEGFLNVLDKTVMMTKPEEHFVINYPNVTMVEFTVDAKSDPSTPVEYLWFKLTVDGEQPVRPIPNSVELSNNNKTLILMATNSTTAWLKHHGTYRCKAYNDYSMDYAEVFLQVEDHTPIVPITPTASPLVSAGIGDYWWIILIVAIIFFIIILIICCCICCQRNRGDSYPVDEKEKKNGNDPEKELMDNGFHDYHRPPGDPMKGSRGSLGSSIKMDSDEEGSLNEYGDIDTGKFTEDGSFIGQYMTDNRRSRNYDSHA